MSYHFNKLVDDWSRIAALTEGRTQRRIRIPSECKMFAMQAIEADPRKYGERPTLRDVYLQLIMTGYDAIVKDASAITFTKLNLTEGKRSNMYFMDAYYQQLSDLVNEVKQREKYRVEGEKTPSIETVIIQLMQLGIRCYQDANQNSN